MRDAWGSRSKPRSSKPPSVVLEYEGTNSTNLGLASPARLASVGD